ncbi:leukocyte receptor cluster member 8 homolog [Neodiprion fabricii]|uniref:leukocyte receptor cluster member 8 homolog n=1 Tax=Neodiprion fabricii TaxID=2872261 RepID=UPI001ED98484|nr:leukocyte receptor cluster member 8 homolog [Neodiprion fabricii]
MSESEPVASQQKQQHQYQQQQQQLAAETMTGMTWQYPPPTHPTLYSPYAGQLYGQGYGSQGQMFYYNQGMMPGYGQTFNTQQVQQQQQQQQQTASTQNNQAKQQSQQPPVPGTPVSLDDDSDLPPLPPGPPPPSQSSQQPNNHNPQLQQPPPFVYSSFPYNGWNGIQNDHSQFNGGQIRFNLQNKKTGLGFSPSGNSGAAKKKRKRNKNLAAQFNNSFPGNNNATATSFIPGANLKSELPPLPPTQHQPPVPPPPSENPPEIVTPSLNSQTVVTAQNIPRKPAVGTTPPTAMTTTSPVGDWPDSLKNYVNRCYEKCKTGVDKDQVEIILKGKITRSANDGSLWVKDWDKEPLPSIHSERMTMTIKAQNQSLKLGNPLVVHGQGGQRKTGLSTSLGARLGARLSAGSHRRSRSRSRSRSRTRSRSRSPPFRKYRRSTSSSSNTSDRDHEHKCSSSKSKKSSRSKPSYNNNNSSGGGSNNSSTSNKKMKKAKQNKSHFYSEFGLATGNGDELGSKEKLQQRAARFSDSISRNSINIKDDGATEFDFTGLHIVGTCKDLEKPYLRLTSAPAASAVRPVSVLRFSLAHVKKRWVAEQDYRYACDQLKSIRQDLTVQGIRDSFTVHVYETHARVALERGDHEEFNQCQTQLRMLYQDLGGENRTEFVAYRILYYIFTKNTQDLTTILASLTAEDKEDECIKHALKVRSAWWLGNFHVFFKLYRKTPRMAAFLMDWFIARERKNALKHMIKSYRQNLAVDFIVAELAFDSLDKFYEFVSELGLAYADPERIQVDCKTSSGNLGSW